VRQELRIRQDLNEKLRIHHAISKKTMSLIVDEALEMYFKNQE